MRLDTKTAKCWAHPAYITCWPDLIFVAGAADPGGQMKHLAETAPKSLGPLSVETNRLKYAHVLLRRGDTQTTKRMFEEAVKSVHKAIQEGNEAFLSRVQLAAICPSLEILPKALEWLELTYSTGARDYRGLGYGHDLSGVFDGKPCEITKLDQLALLRINFSQTGKGRVQRHQVYVFLLRSRFIGRVDGDLFEFAAPLVRPMLACVVHQNTAHDPVLQYQRSGRGFPK